MDLQGDQVMADNDDFSGDLFELSGDSRANLQRDRDSEEDPILSKGDDRIGGHFQGLFGNEDCQDMDVDTAALASRSMNKPIKKSRRARARSTGSILPIKESVKKPRLVSCIFSLYFLVILIGRTLRI